jgi:HAD superfamily hydrolase (TIGR01549 family)
MKQTRTVLFDFGATLDYPRHWLDRFLGHYRAAGIELTREQLDPSFDHATRIAYRSSKMLSAYGLTELVDYLVRLQIEFLSRHGALEVREIIGAAAGGMRLPEMAGWITQSFVAESRRGFEVSREVLRTLEGRFRMGVVSNFYGNLGNILAEADLARFFGTVVDSSQVGIFKPDAGIFLAALERLGSAPSETAMVGDSIDKDCLPAQRLGIKGIWLRNPTGVETVGSGDVMVRSGGAGVEGEPNAALPDFTIDTLAELQDLKWWTD